MLTNEAQYNERLAHYATVVLWICVAALFGQALMFYLMLWSEAQAGVSELSIYWRVLPTLPVMGAVVYLLASVGLDWLEWLPLRWRRLAAAASVVLLIGVVLGLGAGNKFRYLLSDTFRFGICWLTLVLALAATLQLARQGRGHVLLKLIDALAVIGLIDALFTIGLSMLFPAYRISTTLFLFALGWGLFQTHRPRWMGLALAIIAVVAMLMSGKRGVLVVVAAFSPVIFWYQIRQLRTFFANLLIGLPVCLLIAAILQSQFSHTSLGMSLNRRTDHLVDNVYGIMLEGREDQSFEERFDELYNVTNHLRKHPAAIFVGAGFGVEVRMKYDTGLYSSPGKMHQVHSGWGVYLLRNGLLGVAVLAVACWWGMALPLLRNARGPWGPPTMICAMFTALIVILGIKGQLMLEQIRLPLVLALTVGLQEVARRNAKPPPRAAPPREKPSAPPKRRRRELTAAN